MGNIHVKLFKIWTSKSGEAVKDFSTFSSGGHFVWGSRTICAFGRGSYSRVTTYVIELML